MDAMKPSIIEEMKRNFEVVLVAFRDNKMMEKRLNELLKNVEGNNSIIDEEVSKIQSIFDQLSNNADSKKSTSQRTLEDRGEYRFKAENLEKEVLRLQNEISQLKVTEQNPRYTSKESEFLHNENIRLIQREKDLQKEVDKYNKIGEKLQDLINENDQLKKCNIENQSKIIDREVKYKQKSEQYKSTISKQEEEIKNLNEKLNEMKTEIVFLKESLRCRKCNGIQMPQLRMEEVPNSTNQVVQEEASMQPPPPQPGLNTAAEKLRIVEKPVSSNIDSSRPAITVEDLQKVHLRKTPCVTPPNSVDKFVTRKIVASLDETVSKCENEEETRDSPPLEDCTDININKCLTSTPTSENKESKRRLNRRRKEVNYCELEQSPKRGTSKQTEHRKNVSSSNILTKNNTKTQQKRMRTKAEQDDKLLNNNKNLDSKSTSVEDGVNLQNMDPNVEELAVRRVASEHSPFKKPKAPKKRNIKKDNSVLSLHNSRDSSKAAFSS